MQNNVPAEIKDANMHKLFGLTGRVLMKPSLQTLQQLDSKQLQYFKTQALLGALSKTRLMDIRVRGKCTTFKREIVHLSVIFSVFLM
jgi:hypothetical protein